MKKKTPAVLEEAARALRDGELLVETPEPGFKPVAANARATLSANGRKIIDEAKARRLAKIQESS